MGHLVPILLALASLALPDLDLARPLVPAWGWIALLPLPHAFGFLARRAGVHGRFSLASLLGRLEAASPVLVQAAAIGLCGWLGALELRMDTSLSIFAWPRLGLLLALAPFVVTSLLAIDAEARFGVLAGSTRSHLRSFQLRMFAAGLAPVVLYIVLASLVGKDDVLRVRIEEVALVSAGFSVLVLLLFIYALPWLLQRTWNTEVFPPGRERFLLDDLARRAGFRCKEILIWHTGGLLPNAVIVGMTPGSRRVLLSDALLQRLGPRELAAVFAHEMGHARQHHVPLFLVWALALFGGLDLLVSEVDPEGGLFALSALAVGLGLWFVGFGWLSRRVELEADLFSHELTGDGAALASALARVGGGRAQRSGWRHFSMTQRTAFLARAVTDPGVGVGLRTLLRRLRWIGTALFVLVIALQARTLLASRDLDLVRADLRLGRYLSAAERLQDVETAPQEVRELVTLAGEGLGRDFPSRVEAVAACEARAREAGSEREAEPWTFLADFARPD